MAIFSSNGIGEVKGMFSIDHLIYVVLSICLLIGLIFFTRNNTKEKTFKIIRNIAITVAVLEILKIIWNLTIREDVKIEDWLPVYFCSLFIYASLGFSFISTKGKLGQFFYNICLYYLYYGGLVSGLVFMVFPTTSLGVNPLLHVLSFHSLIYHTLMVYVAILIVKYFLTPKWKDFWLYFCSMSVVAMVLIIVNTICDTNFMMLNKPFELRSLIWLKSITKSFYPLVVMIGQNVGTFIVAYGVYNLGKLKDKKNIEKG